MALVIDAFQEGDLISTKTRAVRCLRHAFTPERIAKFRRLYKGNNITFEWETLNEQRTTENRLGRVQSRQH